MNETIKFAFVIKGHDAALRRWAVGYLSEALNRIGVESSVVDLVNSREEECNFANAVMVYRTFDIQTMTMMRRMKAEGKFVMFFLDDYLFQPYCRYSPFKSSMIVPPLNIADCLVSSSAVLLSKMPDKLKILRRSVLDYEAMRVLSQDYRRDKDVFSIGWLSGRGRLGLMDDFAVEFLGELNKRIQGEKCVFKCFGHFNLSSFDKVQVKQFAYHKHDDWKGLYSRFVEMDLGVVVNILDESDDFCRCKSELKLVETGAMGVPLVVSRVEPFLGVVKEGETGFFASTPKEFAEKVWLVMKNEALARQVSSNVKDLIRGNYDADKNAQQFYEDVAEAMSKWKEQTIKASVEPFNMETEIFERLSVFDSRVVGQVGCGSSVEQSMAMPACLLNEVSVLGATYCKKICQPACFEIRVNGNKAREGVIPVGRMVDNAWWALEFEPLILNENSVLTVRITNRSSGTPFTFYACTYGTIAKARIAGRVVEPIAIRLVGKKGN